jgi:hypothetical protein
MATDDDVFSLLDSITAASAIGSPSRQSATALSLTAQSALCHAC